MSKFDWKKFKKGKIAVEVINEEECGEFLEECEKLGLDWNNNKKATTFIPETPISIIHDLFGNGTTKLLCDESDNFECNGIDVVKWVDIKKNNLKEEIIIYRNGSEVVALHKENGKTVKSAKAICSPEDKFDFNVGAKSAFDRLMGERTETSKLSKFNVGEFVEVGDFRTYTHYFKPGTIVEIKQVEHNSYICCFGLIKINGKYFFDTQFLVPEQIKKIIS